MFHKKDKNASKTQKKGLFHHSDRSQRPTASTTIPDTTTIFDRQRGGVATTSSRSDWDHYAVQHDEALVGDPVPIVQNGLNLAESAKDGHLSHPSTTRDGALNTATSSRSTVPYQVGPVVANGPIGGNYSSGTIVENEGPVRGKKGKKGKGRSRSFSSWGQEPFFSQGGYGVGSEPLVPREQRDSRTPLLPDNPWTHNELGRDYVDSYKNGTLPYNSINNVYVAPPITEHFTTTGPHGEKIETTRTATVREELLPPGLAPEAVSASNSQTKQTVIDEVDEFVAPPVDMNIPIRGSNRTEPVRIEREEIRTQPREVLIERRVEERPLNTGRSQFINSGMSQQSNVQRSEPQYTQQSRSQQSTADRQVSSQFEKFADSTKPMEWYHPDSLQTTKPL